LIDAEINPDRIEIRDDKGVNVLGVNLTQSHMLIDNGSTYEGFHLIGCQSLVTFNHSQNVTFSDVVTNVLSDLCHDSRKAGGNVSQSIIIDHDFAGNGYLHAKVAWTRDVDLNSKFFHLGVGEADDIFVFLVIVRIRFSLAWCLVVMMLVLILGIVVRRILRVFALSLRFLIGVCPVCRSAYRQQNPADQRD
jgi:hypothetical protein